MLSLFLLIFFGALAGLIDAIAGGGGLITLPVLAFLLGPGPQAIGTNKIVGFVAALIAFIVYWRQGHFDPRHAWRFSISVALGSFMGSQCAPFVGAQTFKYLLFFTAPFILWMIWRKDLWVSEALAARQRRSAWVVCAWGVAVGFYDGFWGPGGGTLMFLVLLLSGAMPLLPALATAKLANAFSAAFALVGYALHGYVHVWEGSVMAAAISIGAWQGAQLAGRRAAQIVRPTLVIVVSLLMLRLIFFK